MCEKWFFMLWVQGVEGSIPFVPTNKTKKSLTKGSFFGLSFSVHQLRERRPFVIIQLAFHPILEWLFFL